MSGKRNKLGDLMDHLFLQLERMDEDAMSAERIEQEARRAEAIVGVADQIIKTGDLQLKAAKLFADHGEAVLPMLPQIGRSE